MPVFEYKAYAAGGKSTKGIVDAENQKAARMKLKKQGLAVYEIFEKSSGGQARAGHTQAKPSGFSFGNSVSGKDIAMTTRQLASLIKANITLVEALSAMVEQSEIPVLKTVLAQVKQDVNEGSSLAKALSKHPKVFDNIFVNMIEAGESSGTLGLVLIKLADLKEAQMRLKSKITAGLMYPGLMLIVSVFLMVAIFAFVIPKLAAIFEGMNKKMPPLTQLLMGISYIVVNYWYIIVAVVVTVAIVFTRSINSPTGKPKWDAFKLKLPMLGPMIRMIGVTRFASTMSTLLSSGVPILTAMNIAKNLVGNTLLAKAISDARENITEGQSIATPLQRSGQFPPLVIHMISIGEKTGELPEMLKNIASNYEEQVSTKIEGLTSLLEPVMIIGMGGMVGIIVMAIFVPLLDISNIN